MKYIQPILAFTRKYRMVIWGVLGLIICLQLFYPRKTEQEKRLDRWQGNIENTLDEGVKQLKSLEEISVEQMDGNEKNRHVEYLPMLLMIGAVSALFFFQRRGLLTKILPGLIVITAGIVKRRKGERLKWKISITSTKKEGVTFLAPVVVFRKIGEKRKFKIKGHEVNGVFPLTLTKGTGHHFVFDLQKFYEQIPGLEKYPFVNIEIETTLGKTYKSFIRPVIVKRA